MNRRESLRLLASLPAAVGAARIESFRVPRRPTPAVPPMIPVGLDAYLMWERWPYQRIGARAYMRSTYDRAGGNEGADASHFLYQLADDFNVTLDVEGQGVLYFARYNHWHGSPWHYVVDGTDHLVQESSSADPTKPVPGSVFMPEEAIEHPCPGAMYAGAYAPVSRSATAGAGLERDQLECVLLCDAGGVRTVTSLVP